MANPMQTDPTGYGLPVRVIWLLFGVLYFFPGFWKYWRSGLDWAFTDNMKYPLYWNWQGLEARDHELR